MAGADEKSSQGVMRSQTTVGRACAMDAHTKVPAEEATGDCDAIPFGMGRASVQLTHTTARSLPVMKKQSDKTSAPQHDTRTLCRVSLTHSRSLALTLSLSLTHKEVEGDARPRWSRPSVYLPDGASDTRCDGRSVPAVTSVCTATDRGWRAVSREAQR